MAMSNVIYAAHRFGLKSTRSSTVRPKVNNPTEKTSTSIASVGEVKPRKSRRAHQYWLSKGINPHSADFDERVDALIRSYYKGVR